MRRSPGRRRRRDTADEETSSSWYAPPVDPALLRLQARLEAIEADRARVAEAAAAAAAGSDEDDHEPPAVPEADVIIDLESEAALELDGVPPAAVRMPQSYADRIDELERRVLLVEGRARSAEARARAVAARAEDILLALPDLAHELRVLLDADDSTVEQVEAALARMRARVQPQRRTAVPLDTPESALEAAEAD